MLHSLFEGLALGLTLALFFGFGPAFFALLQTGIHRGFYKGFFLALGIFLNDLSIVALSIWGAHAIMVNMQKYQLFGVLGGIILIIFGIFSFRYKSKINGNENTVNDKGPRFYTFIFKGFLMNLANPFVWLFWPTIVLGVAAPFMTETKDMVLFFSGTLSVVFLSDVTKVYLASRIKRFITAKFLQWVNRIAGIGLVIFGFVLIFRTLYVAGIL